MFRVDYQPDTVIEDAGPEETLLALARRHGIPHASACGGNARCSTCRVRVVAGQNNLSPRNEAESSLVARKGLNGHIRLACQTRPLGPVTIRRLVLDACDRELAQAPDMRNPGREMTLAILFSDLRNFTHFVETHLAYDVVHILNRYFHCVGESVLQHGGAIDKYIGDGLMALFGLDGVGPATSCEQVVQAAVEMISKLEDFNEYLTRLFDTRLDLGIGIHVGEVIVADLGHPRRVQFTAIGDAVNVASRIESATKEFHAKILISAAVHSQLQAPVITGKRCQVTLRGKTDPIELVEVLGFPPARTSGAPETSNMK